MKVRRDWFGETSRGALDVLAIDEDEEFDDEDWDEDDDWDDEDDGDEEDEEDDEDWDDWDEEDDDLVDRRTSRPAWD